MGPSYRETLKSAERRLPIAIAASSHGGGKWWAERCRKMNMIKKGFGF
jgi:hypothetical protein